MTDDADRLRTRLIALRASALQQLAAAEVLDAGLMRVVADANACLMVLEENSDGELSREPAA